MTSSLNQLSVRRCKICDVLSKSWECTVTFACIVISNNMTNMNVKYQAPLQSTDWETSAHSLKMFILGVPVTQLVEHATHVQMLCPRCSGPGFESDLWPLAACHPSSYPISKAVLSIKSHEKAKKFLKLILKIIFIKFILWTDPSNPFMNYC